MGIHVTAIVTMAFLGVRVRVRLERGASGLTLQRPWHLMGALEAVDGMLLFGVSTAYLFSVMQVYWSMFTAHTAASQV